MDDKILVQVDAMLAQVEQAVAEIRRALIVAGSVTPEQAARHAAVFQSSRALREAVTQEYMSGRWHRRDGDNFGIVARQLKAPEGLADADRSPGNIRPPDER